jgi:hypothetical protein
MWTQKMLQGSIAVDSLVNECWDCGLRLSWGREYSNGPTYMGEHISCPTQYTVDMTMEI